jgi:hypothetical protein
MSKTLRLALVKPTHGINEVEGTTGGVPNESANLDAIDAAISAPYGLAALTASGAIAQKEGTVTLGSAGALAMTLADPTSGADDGKKLDIVAATAHAHVITIAGLISGGAHNTITLGGAIGDTASLKAIGGKWYLRPSINATATTV